MDPFLIVLSSQKECMEHHNNILGDALLHSSPYLYPFVIEFALIGASVSFIMWRHVGKNRCVGTKVDKLFTEM